MSSLAGECGNEVRGEGAHRRGTGLAGAAAAGAPGGRLVYSPSGFTGKGRVYFSACQRSRRGDVRWGFPPALSRRLTGASQRGPSLSSRPGPAGAHPPRAGPAAFHPHRALLLPPFQRKPQSCPQPMISLPVAGLDVRKKFSSSGESGSLLASSSHEPAARASDSRSPVFQKLKQTSDDSTVQKSDLFSLYWLQSKH